MKDTEDQSAGMAGAPPKRSELEYSELLSKVEERFDTLSTKWHANGQIAWDIYLADDNSTPFNILYSNTEIIVPAVFSRKPTARVLRRFDESRADIPARLSERMLTFLMDKNMPSYPDFMTVVEDSVLDAALPGQGLARVRLVGDLACLDYVQWNRFAWGYARRWEDVPWIAFANDMTPAAVLEAFSADMTEAQIAHFKTKAAEAAKSSEAERSDNANKAGADEKEPDTVRVWELWDRTTKQVHYLCRQVENCCLSIEDDPLQLEGFYPVPSPLKFIHSTTDTLPRPLYKVYQEQAEELNEISTRLRRIIRAIKVRGIYASGLEDIQTVFNEDDDNVLIPSSAAAQVMVTGKGVEAYIWLMPIDMLMKTAEMLYKARDQVRSTIYEILGIGDILRGVTKASETLGAQEIKDKWGSLRVNKARERTAQFIRDALRLLLEVATKHTPPETWAQVTGIKMASAAEAVVAQAANKPLPPEVTWEGNLAILKNDYSRAYIIDVETNSTVDASTSGEKEDTAQFMSAFGQTMAGLRELMGSSPQGWELGKKILVGVAEKFQLGQDCIEQIKQLPAPNPQANPQVQQAMKEVQSQAQALQKQAQTLQAEEQTMQQTRAEFDNLLKDLKTEQETLQQRREQLRRDGDHIQTEIDLALREAQLTLKEGQMDLEMAQQRIVQAGEKATMAGERAVHKSQIAEKNTKLAGREAQSKLQAQQQQNSKSKGAK